MQGDLSARVGGLSGPDREIDWQIAVAVGVKSEPRPKSWAGIDQLQFLTDLPRYTASLDAAMTLVPEDYAIDCLKEGEVGRWYVNMRPRNWIAEWECSRAATPALALTAAALRARAAQENPHAE